MSFIKNKLKNSIIERLILRYAGPFLSNIEIKSNITEGTIFITNVKQKENSCFFEAVEQLLVKLGADVWGVNGMVMIWPHGVEITNAVIRHIEIKVPTPNPFNGEMWKITVDGVDGQIRTLTSERKAELHKKARQKSLEEAEKRLKFTSVLPSSAPVSPVGSRGEIKDTLRPTRDSTDDSDDDGDDSEGGLAKRIDKYFKTHLDISFNNNHIVMHTVEDKEIPEACWDITVGCVSMNLGVGEIHLSPYHRKAVNKVVPTSKWGRGTPPDVKLFEEKIGLTFSAIKFNMKRSERDPPVMVLDFPNKMMDLHLVRKQWQETNTREQNGFDRIDVKLPDDFAVKLHFDQEAIRGVVIRALHQILDGVAINVPNWVDWISVPCPNGWTRAGKSTPPKDDPDALMKEYLSLLGKRTRSQSAGGQLWDFFGFGGCRSGCRGEDNQGNGIFSKSASGELTTGCDDMERIEWFESTQSTEWLAYCRHLPDSVIHEADAPVNERPTTSWLCVPWRRYEVTMKFDASFTVDITSGFKREERMHLDFPTGMAVVMVRDSPAEWTITAHIPGLAISSAGSRWLDLGTIATQLCWGRRELLKPHQLEKLPEEVPSVCRISYLQVSSVDVKIDPAMAVNLMPMLAEVPEVALWPELHYFFGEWGYMPRPMAYVVDIVSIRAVQVKVLSEALAASDKYPKACLNISVNTVDISSNGEAIYMDNDWQMWWNLNVHVGDTNISAHLLSINQPVFTATAIGIKTRRKVEKSRNQNDLMVPTSESAAKPEVRFNVESDSVLPISCSTDVQLMTMSITASPDAMLCLVKLAMSYFSQCKDLVKPLARCGKRVFYKICKVVPPDVPELPSWIWPCTFSVNCDEVQPLFITAKHSLSKVAQVKVSFQLKAVLQEQVMSTDSPFLVLSMNPLRVCVECFDEDGSEAWEPLLEAWDCEMVVQLHLPPRPRLMVLLTSERGVELDVTSTLVMVGRSLFFAYAPLIKTAIDLGVQSEGFAAYLEKKNSMSGMAALNLTGTAIFSTLVTLPRTATEVAIKMQAIFRARRDRRRCKEMSPSTPGTSSRLVPTTSQSSLPSLARVNSYTAYVVCSTADVDAPETKKGVKKKSRKPEPLPKKGVVLKPGSHHQLVMSDHQRLSISMKYLPRELPPTPGNPERQRALSFRRVLPKGVTGSLIKIRRHSNKVCACFRGQQMSDSNSSSMDRGQAPPVGSGTGVGSDVERLMNICRHGQTAIIPASCGKNVAYICEVVSPSVNDRMLLVQSPLRIFNYTSDVIDICFTDGLYPLEVSDEIAQGCSYAASVLGQEQPVDPNPYGLPAGDLTEAKTKDQSWRLPSNCFASVPPRLRHPGGGLAIRARSKSCKSWDSQTYDIEKLVSGDVCLYKFPNGDMVRIYFITRQRFESALVAGTGQRVTCCDICFVPCLSILSMCPLPLEVHIESHIHTKQETILLEPGKAKNFFRHVHVNMKMRFEGSDIWSHTLKHIDARENNEKEELVTLPAANGTAATEVHLKQMQETCIISSPLWFVDKTKLGLRCTDKKGQEFPRAGPFYLPASQHETILVLNPNMHSHKNLSSGSVTRHSTREARETLPKQFYRKSTSEIVMHTDSQTFPMKITSKHLDHMFGEFQEGHVPPVQLLTMVPGLMFASTLPLSVRFNGGEPLSVPADNALPIWPRVSGRTPQKLDEHQVEFQIDEHSGWSKPIKCSHSLTGVYSLAMAPLSYNRSSSTSSLFSKTSTTSPNAPAMPAGPVRTLSVEISDTADSVLAFRISDQSDECFNKSPSVDTAYIETDSLEEHSKKGARAGLLSLGEFRNQEHQKPTPWAFTCPSGVGVGIGWFLPFAKDHTDDVKLWLQWEGEEPLCGPVTINLHSTIFYVFLRPDSASKRKTTVARVRQHKQRRCIEIYDEENITSQVGYHAEEICGVCGSALAEINKESDASDGIAVKAMGTIKNSAGGFFNAAADLTGVDMLHTASGQLPVLGLVKGEDDSADQEGLGVGRIKGQKPRVFNLPGAKANGTIKCAGCQSILRVPGMELFSQGSLQVVEKERVVRKFDTLQNAGKTPIATFCSIMRWIGALVININLRIPSAGISLISKRQRREVLYCLVEGIDIKLQAPDGMNTHVLRLHVQGVRCDRFDVTIGRRSPCVLSSTMVVPKGKDIVEIEETPAVEVTIMREYASAFNIFIRETTAHLFHTWEVDVDTALLNDLFEVGDECTKALGPMAKHLFASLGQTEELSPSLVFERLQQMGEEHVDFLWKKAGRVIQLENYDASAINAKIWLRLKLADLKFVPAEVRRFLYWFGVLMMPSLSASKVHIERRSESLLRGSVIEIGKAFMRLYRNDVARVVRSLLGSTRLTHGHSTESGMANFQKAFGFSLASNKHIAPDKDDDVEEVIIVTPRSETISSAPSALQLLQEKRKAKHQGSKAFKRTAVWVPDNHPEPAGFGEPWLRLPRLLLARARVMSYDEFHAQVLQACGNEMLQDCLHIFKLRLDPLELLIVTCDHLSIGELLLSVEFSHNDLQGKMKKQKYLKKYQWPWDKVRNLDFVTEEEMEIVTSDAGNQEVSHRVPCNLSKQDKHILLHIMRKMRKEHMPEFASMAENADSPKQQSSQGAGVIQDSEQRVAV